TLLLLHGFPSADHMFRDLIPLLADRYHLVAPDLPSFGQSEMPVRDAFNHTFNNLAEQSCCACAQRAAKEISRFLKCPPSKFLEKSRKINRQTEQHEMNATANDPNSELQSLYRDCLALQVLAICPVGIEIEFPLLPCRTLSKGL